MIEESLDKSMNKQWNEYRCKLHKDFKNVAALKILDVLKGASLTLSQSRRKCLNFIFHAKFSTGREPRFFAFNRESNMQSSIGKRFGYSEPHKSLSRKMRLGDDAASLENAALRTRVKDLEDQLKNWSDVLSRIPRDILLPVQNGTSQASSSNEDL
ncbi:hypothetical protein Adt_49041 [Abeliophyllum distichum]|uniref:Uncharacterized protein n=1 Tax=Abeliophyllum distichum TaxID=126358 RepID=A0ABD1NR82_9LAMI